VDTGYYVQLLDRVSSEKEKSFFCDHIASFSRKMRRLKKIDAKILRKNSKLQRKRCKIHQKRLNFAKFSHFANIFALFIFAKRFVCWKPYY